MPRKVIKGYNDLETVNPELAAQWHPTKNGSLLPTDCSFSSTRKIWWICKNGHEWEATVYNRYHGSGCPYCAGKKVLPELNDIATTHPNLALEWHPTKNAPLTPAGVSIGSVKRVWWICRQGHEWQASPNTRSKTGCPYCSGKAVLPGYNDLATTDPTLAEEWHPTKNGDLTPCMVNRGSVKKVWWLGKCGHEWQATINNRRYGHGCPICNKRNKSSFPEQALFFYIKKLFPDSENGYKDGLPNKMELDIFVPSLLVGIEYDGIAWHNSKEAKRREKEKYDYCHEMGIRLIRIKETTENSSEENCDTLIMIPPNPSYVDLNNAINRIIDLMGFDYKKACVDVANNSTIIKSQYLSSLSEKSLQSVNPSLAEEWHPTKNGSLLPNMFSPSSHDKVWWLGKCGHEWQAVISSRNAGRGCPYCSGNKLLLGFNDLETTNPELALEWHPVRNGELTPNDVRANSHKIVWWLGKCGHEWSARIYDRSKGHGCPYCANKRKDTRSTKSDQ